MKAPKNSKNYLIACSLVFTFYANAANTYNFKYPSIDTIVTYAAGVEYLINAKAVNLSNSTVMMAYKLKSSTIPAGWEFTLCDSQKCNFPGAPSAEGKSTLSISGLSQYFKIGVSPTTLLGILELEYETYDVATPSVIQIVKFKLSNLPESVLRWGRTSISLDGVGASQSVNVTSNTTWTITGLPSWVQVNSISGSNNGIIKFSVVDNNITSTDRNVTITITGPNNFSKLNLTQTSNSSTSINASNVGQKNFIFSPNPVNQNDFLFINYVADVEIFDLIGNSILKQSGANKINLEGIRKGIYFLRINDKETKKFVID